MNRQQAQLVPIWAVWSDDKPPWGAVQDGGSAFFAQTMVEFLKSAEETVKRLRTQSADTMEQLRNLYAYFGERYDGNDPVKILGTLASFMDLYAKSVKQYRVWPHTCLLYTSDAADE